MGWNAAGKISRKKFYPKRFRNMNVRVAIIDYKLNPLSLPNNTQMFT